jgi:hypothetical protein
MHGLKIVFDTRQRQAALCGLVTLIVALCASAHVGSHRNHSIPAPVISGTPPVSDTAGQPYRFSPSASGPSGYTLKFAVSGKPAWATFNAGTGQLSGTPATADVGSYSNIVISVSDGVARAALPAFSVTVLRPQNVAPTISGQPPTSVNVGSAYNFIPAASDANGDALSFSIQNKPSWATFSAASGQLSGTPSAADAGSYANIIISVSDAVTTISLAAVTITVQQISNGAASLTWMPPTQMSDGAALTSLAGYRIYYGTSPNTLTKTIQVANPGLASYTVENLSPATWYFAVTAYVTSGAESVLSSLGSTTIQ